MILKDYAGYRRFTQVYLVFNIIKLFFFYVIKIFSTQLTQWPESRISFIFLEILTSR
jgi:hypothetical protein